MKKTNFSACWGCLSPLNCIKALTLSLLLKFPYRILESWFFLWRSFNLMWLFVSIELSNDLIRNTISMSVLLFLAAIWISQINLQKWSYGIVGFSLAASWTFGSLSKNITHVSVTLLDVHLNWVALFCRHHS